MKKITELEKVNWYEKTWRKSGRRKLEIQEVESRRKKERVEYKEIEKVEERWGKIRQSRQNK